MKHIIKYDGINYEEGTGPPLMNIEELGKAVLFLFSLLGSKSLAKDLATCS